MVLTEIDEYPKQRKCTKARYSNTMPLS